MDSKEDGTVVESYEVESGVYHKAVRGKHTNEVGHIQLVEDLASSDCVHVRLRLVLQQYHIFAYQRSRKFLHLWSQPECRS